MSTVESSKTPKSSSPPVRAHREWGWRWAAIGAVATTIATLAAAVVAALMTNHSAVALEKRSATRTACVQFAFARISLNLAGKELVRVLEGAELYDSPHILDIQEKRVAYDAATAQWLLAIADLELTADDELYRSALDYNSTLEKAVKATFDYYVAVANAKGSKNAGTAPQQAWETVDAAGQPVLDACRQQIAKG